MGESDATSMLGTSWFNDSDPLERNGAIAIAAMLALSSTYLLIAPKFIVILLWIFLVIAIGIRIFDRATWNLEEQNLTPRTMVLRFVYVVVLAVTPALFHGATGAAVIGSGRGVIYKPDANIPVVSANFVVEHLPTSPTLWDPVFLSMDTVLLGWIFPRGQVGLWAQSSALFSPAMPIGKLITEILQCTYMSYYFWGNGMILFLVLTSFRKATTRSSDTVGAGYTAWRRTRMLLYGWISAYCLNFLVNFITPAVSPRLWLGSEYNTPLEGLFLGQMFQNAIKSAAGGDPFKPKSFGAFPSGHVGLTWLAAISAGQLGFFKYQKFAVVGACLMTCAVVYLRYHYFVDALFASALVYTGLVVGRMTNKLKDEDSSIVPTKVGASSVVQPLKAVGPPDVGVLDF